jgi:hypothetical protein
MFHTFKFATVLMRCIIHAFYAFAIHRIHSLFLFNLLYSFLSKNQFFRISIFRKNTIPSMPNWHAWVRIPSEVEHPLNRARLNPISVFWEFRKHWWSVFSSTILVSFHLPLHFPRCVRFLFIALHFRGFIYWIITTTRLTLFQLIFHLSARNA